MTKTPTPDVVQRKAVAGVTGKGQSLGRGIISTPVRAYFMSQERMVFDIQIASAMKTYKALNGHFPKTDQEFWDKIIKANQITLPKLTGENERYEYLEEKAADMRSYDPADPPLVVERPRR
jgi:hypothetical protein